MFCFVCVGVLCVFVCTVCRLLCGVVWSVVLCVCVGVRVCLICVCAFFVNYSVMVYGLVFVFGCLCVFVNCVVLEV